MSKKLKLRQYIFAGPENDQLCLEVQRFETKEIFILSARDVFNDIELLNSFNSSDIRVICYFATAEEYTQDLMYVRKNLSNEDNN